MILTTEVLSKYQGKLEKIPELRRFILTPDHHLCMNRIEKKPVIFSCYAAFSPKWNYWNFYGTGCSFEE